MARDLLDELEKTQFREYAGVKRSHIPEFDHYDRTVDLLSRIAALRCETPCRLGGDGCVGSCPIAACVKERSFEGCWECPSYRECENLAFLKPFHGDTPLRNLERIRESGVEAWATRRGKFYRWER